MVKSYVNDWIVRITDITEEVSKMREAIKTNKFYDTMLPVEHEYPMDEKIKKLLGII